MKTWGPAGPNIFFWKSSTVWVVVFLVSYKQFNATLLLKSLKS